MKSGEDICLVLCSWIILTWKWIFYVRTFTRKALDALKHHNLAVS